MRVEWAKTHARANRWQEEVLLVQEEMRRVIAFLDSKATWWRLQGHRHSDLHDDINTGLAAYAAHQSHLMQHLAETFATLWYPTLLQANLQIEWPHHYISYAQAHPPTFRSSQHRATIQTVVRNTRDSELESSNEGSGDEGSSDGYDSAEGDDDDVSPYR